MYIIYELWRIQFNNKKQSWDDVDLIGYYDTLEDAKEAYWVYTTSDEIDHQGKYQHIIKKIEVNEEVNENV